ncbi:MAG: UDP-N-acetylmuramate:L-alanyl-gamma-D-glutamyl-meso-diaminopimelate ligase [Bacteroidales bacterium]|nr:UDP-N-acetylmuramate:L-alanyl-gamma-D-glutamyl-meso-diaminopimelate ligase [Bacteroidales bacterium]
MTLNPSLNYFPEKVDHIHLMGICGTGMGSLAGMLKTSGYKITGSDQNVYPPMSDFLAQSGIPVTSGYTADNLDPRPDLVIVGNTITRQNPEAIGLADLGIPYVSFPQTLAHYYLDSKTPLVVCGTHGKTTTSSMLASLLHSAGQDTGFMIGGLVQAFGRNYNLGNSQYFVVEGDEYDTAFFDKGPKFLHYQPHIAILTSIEFDHADIYRDMEHLLESFRKLIQLIPPTGLLIANGDDPVILKESERAKCPVITYGLTDDVHWRATDILTLEDFTTMKILKNEQEYMTLSSPLYGNHNVANLLSTVILTDHLKVERSVLSEAMKSFGGIKRRQEIRGEKKGILVLDDFAHHPTAVRETIIGVKEKYGDRRLLAVFEPRSNTSRRNIFQKRYAASFDKADLILIPEPPLMETIPKANRFSSSGLVDDIKKRGLKAFYSPNTDHLLGAILRVVRNGDVVLIMSNGSFDHLHDRLLEEL